MGEVVVRGARLPIRNSVLAEVTASAAQIAQEVEDRAVLTSQVAAISLSFDGLDQDQARRIALAVVAATEQVRRSYSVLGAPPADVEAAAQLAAIGMFLGRTYGV